MGSVLRALLLTLPSLLRSNAALRAEILALRHQVTVLQRQLGGRRVRLERADRILWVWLLRLWSDWRSPLVIVQPETVLRWHRQGFRLYWRWKSRPRRPGRPRISQEIQELIRKMADANPTWGAPRIHGELLTLGIRVSESTVSKYLPRRRKPPSQGWRTFLANHLHEAIAVDFAVVPTVTFQILFVFVVLSLERRKVLHLNVTTHPSAQWTAQQVVEACAWNQTPSYLIRDRDGIYGDTFRRRVCFPRHRRDPDRATLPLAERLRRALHRLLAPGVLGSRARPERAAMPPDPLGLRPVLQPLTHPSGAREGRARASRGPRPGARGGRRASPRSAASTIATSGGPLDQGRMTFREGQVVEKNVRLTVEDIRERSPILREMEAAGQIKIAGALYDMKTGAIQLLD